MTGMLTCFLGKTDQEDKVVDLPFMCTDTWNGWSSVLGWMMSLRVRIKGQTSKSDTVVFATDHLIRRMKYMRPFTYRKFLESTDDNFLI